MHLEIKNSLKNKILQLIVIKVQVVLLKPHHQNSICCEFLCYEWWFAYGFWNFANVVMYYLYIEKSVK